MFDQFSDIVYTSVGSGVDFHQVQKISSFHLFTNIANTASVPRCSTPLLQTRGGRASGRGGMALMQTVQSLSQNPSNRCFTNAAAAREQISMGNSAAFYLVLKRLNNVFLVNYFLKSLGSIFSV